MNHVEKRVHGMSFSEKGRRSTCGICQWDLDSHVGGLKVQHPDGTTAAAAQHLVQVSNCQGFNLLARYLQSQQLSNELYVGSLNCRLDLKTEPCQACESQSSMS